MAESRIEELRRRIERDPGSRLFAQLAEQLRKEGELGEAIGVARAGLERHPNYPSARLTLGRALLDSGDPAAARAELDAAAKGAPDNILASRLLGEALETLGDLGGALLQFRRTLEMAPSDRHVEARVQAIQERLGAPAAGEGARGGGTGASAASGGAPDHTKPMTAVKRADAPPPGAAGAPDPEDVDEGDGGLPPTIRIRMPGDPVGGVRAPMPPPAVLTHPPAVAASPEGGTTPSSGEPAREETTLPARTRLADEALPGTLPGAAAAEGANPDAEAPAQAATSPESPPEGGGGPGATGGAGSRETTLVGNPADDSDLAPTLPSSKAAEYAVMDESLPPPAPPGSVTAPKGVEAEGGAPGPGAPERAGDDRAWPGAEPAAVHEPAPPSSEPPPSVLEPAAVAGPPAATEPPAVEPPAAAPSAVAAMEPADTTGTPLSSGTLAELYFQQGLLERAIEIYREVLAGEPGNEAARARLAEIAAEAEASAAEGPARPAGEGEGREPRRRALERTIERLEALLAIVRRR